MPTDGCTISHDTSFEKLTFSFRMNIIVFEFWGPNIPVLYFYTIRAVPALILRTPLLPPPRAHTPAASAEAARSERADGAAAAATGGARRAAQTHGHRHGPGGRHRHVTGRTLLCELTHRNCRAMSIVEIVQ